MHAIAPLPLPRQTLCDTRVGGYDIPAHTAVIPNVWAAHMDPAVWDEPEKFNPGRFLDDKGEVTSKRDHMIAFSLGKRACMGELLARQMLYLFVTGVLQNFNVLPPEGQTRIQYTPRLQTIIFPIGYKFRIVPRDTPSPRG